MYGKGRRTTMEVWDRSGDPQGGLERVEEVRDGSRDPRGRPGRVGGPSGGMGRVKGPLKWSGMGRETFREVQNGLERCGTGQKILR